MLHKDYNHWILGMLIMMICIVRYLCLVRLWASIRCLRPLAWGRRKIRREVYCPGMWRKGRPFRKSIWLLSCMICSPEWMLTSNSQSNSSSISYTLIWLRKHRIYVMCAETTVRQLTSACPSTMHRISLKPTTPNTDSCWMCTRIKEWLRRTRARNVEIDLPLILSITCFERLTW